MEMVFWTGRGIFCWNHLHELLSLLCSPWRCSYLGGNSWGFEQHALSYDKQSSKSKPGWDGLRCTEGLFPAQRHLCSEALWWWQQSTLSLPLHPAGKKRQFFSLYTSYIEIGCVFPCSMPLSCGKCFNTSASNKLHLGRSRYISPLPCHPGDDISCNGTV